MRKLREAAAILLAAALFISLTYGFAWLLREPRDNYGCTWARYEREERNSLDVLYLGTSLVYCDVIPAVVWKETGLTSYVMTGALQSLPLTYYYLRQACKTQSPQAVVVELNAIYFPRYADSIRTSLLYMPWSGDRLLATFRGGAAKKDFPELLFPLLGNHSRVYSVTKGEIKKNLFPQADEYAGYTLLTAVYDQKPRQYEVDEDTFSQDVGYLRKISDFCARCNIKLVFYLAPALSPLPQDARETVRRAVEEVPHALFFDCNEDSWPDFNPEEEWFDPRHLNLYGAVPFSRRFAAELEALGLRSQHENDALWQERYDLVMDQYSGA